MAMGLRERRGSRDGAADESGPVVYRMRAKLFDLGDDYWVETTAGRTVFQVDGRAVRFRGAFSIRDVGGEVVATLKERVAGLRDTMSIGRPGRPTATIRKEEVAPLRQHYAVEADDVGTIDVHGNLTDHEYTFERDGHPVAEVSKRWMTVRDSFGVEVQPGADTALVLAATMAVDAMAG
jgi:uncharacterized protein YxjI